MTEENEVPLLGELCKSTQTTLERWKGLDGMGDIVGVCLNGIHCDVPEKVC